MAYNIIFLVFAVIMLVGWLCGMMVKNLQENAASPVKKSFSLSDLFEKKSMPISSVGILVSFRMQVLFRLFLCTHSRLIN